MKNSKLYLILLLFSISYVGYSQNPIDTGQGIDTSDIIVNVGAKEFKELIAQGGTLLDVRMESEIAEGYIEGAKSYDYYEDGFKVWLDSLPKDKPVYVYCRFGRRSLDTANMLRLKGFPKVYNLSVGLMGWIDEGYPTVKP